jgi:L-ectoine synthase
MYVRNIEELKGTNRDVDWGNGKSYRFLIERDGMGFTVCHTIVRAGSESLLEYRNHLEACYCIAGEGEVEDMAGTIHPVRPGDLYVLDKHDRHYLRAGPEADLVLVSVFNPALKGTEVHDLTDPNGSSY